jgi:signal transduction histidine kinase
MIASRRALLVIAAFVAGVVAMWGLTFAYLAHLERAELTGARLERQAFARSMAEYEASSVRAIDLALVFLRHLWRHDPASFDRAVHEHEELLRKERVIQVAVVDRHGALLYSRLPRQGNPNFLDRDYFIQHSQATDDRMIVSEPVLGRITQRWAIQLSRALRDADGAFAGIIVMAVPPPALGEVFRELDLGEGSVITLSRADGQVLARSTGFDAALKAPFAAWRAEAAKGLPAGEFYAGGAVDGVPRYFSYRRVPDYGLAVLVGQSVAAVRAPYESQRNYLLAFVSVATLLGFGVTVSVLIRLRDKARFSERHESLMHELHDGCIQAIYAVGLRLQGARSASNDPQRLARTIAEAEADLNLVIQDLRAFIHGTRVRYSGPEFLAQIERAIPASHRSTFALDIDLEVAASLSAERAEHVLRIVREAVANVARHADATSCRITLARHKGQVRLRIEDDGKGTAAAAGERGLGLAHIQARAKKLGGSASVGPGVGRGTQVAVEFPA